LLHINGQALIQRTLAHLRGAGIQDVVVVVGEHHDALAPLLQSLGVATVFNPQAMALGIASSQRLGLAQMQGSHPWVMMALADQPLLQASDVRALIDAFENRPPGMQALYPQVNGQPGNPVLFSRTAVTEILSTPSDMACKAWRQAQSARVLAWPSNHLGYVTDLDTPQDIEKLQLETGWTCTWPTGS
jgi:molybdenum cofactor cytidylyltransferase